MELDASQKERLLKQVEFYFSDSNLPKDKFLKEKIAADPAGFVDLNIICAFVRMRDILKLAKDVKPEKVPADVVAAAAEALKESALLEVNAEGTKIKRKEALREWSVVSKEVDERSLYVRPFPMDVNVDSLTEYFGQHGKVNCVQMRRNMATKSFKGSVFVEFADAETMNKVAGMKLEHSGAELHLEKKVEYIARKKEEAKAGADDDEASNDDLPDGAGGKVGQGKVAGSRKRAQDGSSAPAAKVAKTEGGDAAEDAEGETENVAAAHPAFVAGCLVHFTMEAAVPESVGVRTIVDALGGRDKVRFLELDENKTTGYLRFQDPQIAAKELEDFLAKPEAEQNMVGTKATWRKVEGEEEQAYYKRIPSGGAGGRGRGGRGGGGRGGGRGRGGRGGRGRRGGRH